MQESEPAFGEEIALESEPTFEEDIIVDSEPTFHGEVDLQEENEILEDVSFDTLDEEFSLPDEIDLNVSEETNSEETVTESESSFDTDFDMPSEDEFALNDDFSIPENTETEESFDSDFTMPDETENQETSALDSIALGAGLAGVGFAAGALLNDDEDFSIPEENLSDSELPNFDNLETSLDDSFEMEDDAPFSFDSLPDFDEIPELQDTPAELLSDFNSSDFELPEFSDEQYIYDNQNQGGDLLFDTLYEENIKESERSQKRTTIPVVICVLCALICVGVLAAILWLTKPSLFGTKEKEPELAPIVQEELPIVEEEPILPVVEDLTAAKEDEIVITPEPVVPEIPEPKEEVVPTQVTYRIKWGDTLWDLADSYYQNPWLYNKIAKANNIKNPDLIISGTDIVIPPLN